MTRKPSYRYKCDFCGKTSGSGGHMARHEKHCTLNPQRVCRVCKETGLEEQDMATLIAALGTGDAAGVKALESLAERCPACMLAAIRQSGLQRHDTWESRGCHDPICTDEGFRVAWNYKQAQETFWRVVNDTRVERESW